MTDRAQFTHHIRDLMGGDATLREAEALVQLLCDEGYVSSGPPAGYAFADKEIPEPIWLNLLDRAVATAYKYKEEEGR